MICKICIENATTNEYSLYDANDTLLIKIPVNGYYYLKLNYNKVYTFKNGSDSFTFTLDACGSISGIMPSSLVHLEVKDATQHTPDDIDPLYVKPKHQRRNKLLITPINNVFARAQVPLIQYMFDLSYGS